MKTRRISAHRIGAERKSRKRKPSFSIVILVVILGLGAYLFWLPPNVKHIVQITVIATASPLPIATPLPPTVTPSPAPSPVVAPSPVSVFGVALGDVWLRKSAGGERLPAAVLKGQQVEVLGVSGDYLKVQWTDGETVLSGWVTAEWVEVQE